MGIIMLTEQRNPRTMHIDHAATLDIIHIMNDEDATVAHVVRDAAPEIARAVDAIAPRMERGGRLIYVGAGTSGRLALIDAVECVPTFNVEPDRVQALLAGGNDAFVRSIEGAEDDRAQGAVDVRALNLTADDSVVGIAASGRTPYVVGALQAARDDGVLTIAVSCNAPAPILDIADIAIAAPVGPEVVTGSTRLKAGTAQKMILNMLSTATMIRLGKVYSNLMVDVQIVNEKLAARAVRIVAEATHATEAEARALLQQSDNQIKVAIVMRLLNVSADEARAILQQSRGKLGEALANLKR
ncbi:MAG: N-acetylmuramic acid 6-phosphate etherase [Chloroflexi bacterium]|nr:MAG: N-acetylmuramic acid 6-phosphate etherase [Chloroflexota bacterium]